MHGVHRINEHTAFTGKPSITSRDIWPSGLHAADTFEVKQPMPRIGYKLETRLGVGTP